MTEGDNSAAASGFTNLTAGALFLALGVAALWVGAGYEIGNATDMGPGYFPRLIGWALAAFGLIVGGRGVIAGGWARPFWALRPLVVLSTAFIVFGLAVDRLGLFIAGALTVAVAAFAQPGMRWPRVAATASGLAAFCALLFGYALNLSLPVWPR
jgi:putative tricarboxylic transport membrane protein